MRELARITIENAQRYEDRTGADETHGITERLAREAVRLARVATSIHMADAVPLAMAAFVHASERTPPRREQTP